MSSAEDIVAVKDPDSERPIPSAWRPVLMAIVGALSRHDYQLSAGILGVAPVSEETAEHIKRYIASYGDRLTDLPEESWSSSVCIWNGHAWDCLIDLWTVGEGRSDLVLSVQVTESQVGFSYSIYMVYVP